MKRRSAQSQCTSPTLPGPQLPLKQAESKDVMARVTGGTSASATPQDPGAAIYAGACAQCHGEFGRAPALAALNLALSSTLRTPRPDNVIRIVREGIDPTEGGPGPIMPGFGDVLTDRQLTDLVAFLRSHFARQPAWSDIDDASKGKQKPTQEARSAQ